MTRPAPVGTRRHALGCDAKQRQIALLPFGVYPHDAFAKIPARFEMGLSLPEGPECGQIAGYHWLG